MSAAESWVEPDDYDGVDVTAEVFRIEHPEQASWALRKIKRARARIAEVERIYAAEVERIEQWATTAKAGAMRDVEFFERLLTDYVLTRRESDPKFKVDSPHGTVTVRRLPARVDVIDPEAFIVWARSNDRAEFVRTKHEVDKTAVKEAAKNGESLPGVDIVPGDERVYVTTSEGDE